MTLHYRCVRDCEVPLSARGWKGERGERETGTEFRVCLVLHLLLSELLSLFVGFM